MRVSIFGLGYVGAVSCGCLADLGHEVIGCDISQAKVDLINAGKPPIVEDGLDELLRQAGLAGSLSALGIATPNIPALAAAAAAQWTAGFNPRGLTADDLAGLYEAAR